ncbi:MAG: TPM domain-containing protein [Candidatus Methylomirabilota bacterium]
MRRLSAFRLRRFLTVTEREQIAAALAEAGRHTRARIGLSIDEQATRDPRARARTLFQEWQLPEGERPTAVLVYVSAPSRTYAIVGGEDVHRIAPQTFWELLDRDLHHHFEEGRYCDGIFKAIAQVAIQLERHFPREPETRPEAPSDP